MFKVPCRHVGQAPESPLSPDGSHTPEAHQWWDRTRGHVRAHLTWPHRAACCSGRVTLVKHPEEMKRMRGEARAEYEAKYTEERNGTLLEEVFDNAMRVSAARQRSSGRR